MQIFELIMIICFGFSWPLSVIKSIRSKSTKGKSIFFTALIIIGYVSGLTGKIVNNKFGSPMDIVVFVAYILNLIFVSIDFVLFFVNRNREKKEEALALVKTNMEKTVESSEESEVAKTQVEENNTENK